MRIITQFDAEQIKRSYLHMSPLEREGFFAHPDTSLSQDEIKAVHYINSLSDRKASELMIVLDRIEAHESGIKKDPEFWTNPGFQRDLQNLRDKGIDVADHTRVSFVYGVINAKLNGLDYAGLPEIVRDDGLQPMRELARLKAVAHIEIPKDLEMITAEKEILTDARLKELVAASVEDLEIFFTKYFTFVGEVIRHFLPLEIETGQGKIYLKEGYADALKSDSYIRYGKKRLPEGTKFIDYPSMEMYDSRFAVNHRLSYENKEYKKWNFFGFRLEGSHELLKGGVFGRLLSGDVDIDFEIKESAYTADLTMIGSVGRLSRLLNVPDQEFALRFMDHLVKKYGYSGSITENILYQIASDMGIPKNNDGERSISYMLRDYPRFREFCFVIDRLRPERGSDKTYSVAQDLRHLTVHELARVNPGVRYETLKTQPWFIFPTFNVDKYSLKTYKHFWQTLEAYAQAPAKMTQVMVEAFRDNYLANPSISLQDHYEETKNCLKQLVGIFEEAKQQGRLEDVCTPEIKSLPEEGMTESLELKP